MKCCVCVCVCVCVFLCFFVCLFFVFVFCLFCLFFFCFVFLLFFFYSIYYCYMSYKAICKYINNFFTNTVYYLIALKQDYIMHENILSQITSLLQVENNFPQHVRIS